MGRCDRWRRKRSLTRGSEGRYEFVGGELVRILATRQHGNVADFLAKRLDREVDRLGLDYRVSGRISIVTTTTEGAEHSRNPDVSVVTVADGGEG